MRVMDVDITSKRSQSGTYKLFLQLTCLPKSLNKKFTSNKWGRDRENREFDMLVACEFAMKPKPSAPLERVKLSFVRHSHRMLDYDNCVGSLKPVVDALVSCGCLSDDTWKVTGPWDVTQKFRSKKDGPLLEIMVQSLPSPE